jgi:hypothetical protein
MRHTDFQPLSGRHLGVVVPQEKILEVLEMPKLKVQRDEAKKARRQPLAVKG